MSTTQPPRVTGGEVARWVEAIHDLHPEHADLAGGVAPATIAAQLDSPRTSRTMHRHLDRESEVRAVIGVYACEQGGGRRTGYVPVEGGGER